MWLLKIKERMLQPVGQCRPKNHDNIKMMKQRPWQISSLHINTWGTELVWQCPFCPSSSWTQLTLVSGYRAWDSHYHHGCLTGMHLQLPGNVNEWVPYCTFFRLPSFHASFLFSPLHLRKRERFLRLYQRSPLKENSPSPERSLWICPTDSAKKLEDASWLLSGQPLSGKTPQRSVQTALRSIFQKPKRGFKKTQMLHRCFLFFKQTTEPSKCLYSWSPLPCSFFPPCSWPPPCPVVVSFVPDAQQNAVYVLRICWARCKNPSCSFLFCIIRIGLHQSAPTHRACWDLTYKNYVLRGQQETPLEMEPSLLFWLFIFL